MLVKGGPEAFGWAVSLDRGTDVVRLTDSGVYDVVVHINAGHDVPL